MRAIPITGFPATHTVVPSWTSTGTPTLTVTASPTDSPTSTAGATPTDTPSSTATPTPSTTPTPAFCGGNSPIADVVVNPDIDGEERVETGIGAPNQCLDQTLNQGGCRLLQPLDGSVENYFDASNSIDQRACTPDQAALEYQWQIFRPPGLGSTPYSSSGISGRCSPILTIRRDSLPSFDDTEAAGDPYWRVRLTIVPQPRPGEAMTPAPRVLFFRFEYIQTSLTLQSSTNCQLYGICDPEQVHSFPSTEPLCTQF